MPFATEPREHVHGTWPMCRVVVATRLLAPEREYAVFRALQFAQFTTTLDLEDAEDLREAHRLGARASTPTRSSPPPSDPETEALFEDDRDEARTRRRQPDRVPGQVARPRPTAASATRRRASVHDARRPHARGRRLPVDRGLRRAASPTSTESLDAPRRPPRTPPRSSPRSRTALTTAEVALIMTAEQRPPDLDKAEDALIAAIGDGGAARAAVRPRRAVAHPAAPARALSAAA